MLLYYYFIQPSCYNNYHGNHYAFARLSINSLFSTDRSRSDTDCDDKHFESQFDIVIASDEDWRALRRCNLN